MKLMYLAAGMAAAIALAVPPRLAAQENAYDVLGKALVPIATVFAADDNGNPVPHGLVLDAHLISASKLPPELQGQAVHVALMSPDKLLVQAPIAGQILTVCRVGDQFWAEPGSKIQAILGQIASPSPGMKKKKRKDAKLLGPLMLPVPQKALVFLPVLFQVADGGTETIGTTQCRALDVQLMPQLTKSLHADGWSARMWVAPDYSIVQVAATGPDWTGTVAIDKLALPPTLPDSTFQPQGTDVLKLTTEQFLDLLSEVGRK
jgi:hypothetical protein